MKKITKYKKSKFKKKRKEEKAEETKNIVICNKYSRQYCAFRIGTGFLPLLSTIYMEILDQIEWKNCKYIYITFLQIHTITDAD